MPRQARFATLMSQLRDGNDQAAAAVFERFARRLIALAGKQLDEASRRKEDPEDVVQSVFRSFFRRYQESQFDVTGWDSLWAILTVITVRKCVNRNEYFHAERRDIRREVNPGAPDQSRDPFQALDAEPTAEQAAVLTETVEHLLDGLEERDRHIVTLHLQGYTIPEISTRAGRSERTVSRVLERTRGRLLRLRADEGG